MPVLSPGWATDLAILELTGSVIEDRGDHLVVRTPHNPDYHWGNCLLVTDPATVDEASRWVSRFSEALPGADWVTIGLPVFPNDAGAWATEAVELEQLDVLSTRVVPRSTERPDGYSVRPLRADDWEQIVARECAENAVTGDYDQVIYERFVRERNAAQQAMCERGVAAWFGAFAGDDLVADLGIVVCGATARYQAVGTHPDHRRRGLASHLLGVAANWSVEQGCDAWVIVTEERNDAGRVYRRAGFEPDVSSVNAYRKPPVADPRAG